MEKLAENKLLLYPKKCEFYVTRTKYLGYIISNKGIEIDPQSIKAIQDKPIPTRLKGVQRFLGMGNYYWKFVKNYSRIVAPLTELSKKDRKFEWGLDQ